MRATRAKVKKPEVEVSWKIRGFNFWFGRFKQGEPDRERLSLFMEILMENKLTMLEKHLFAENLVGYYEQITGDLVRDTPDCKQLRDWVFEGYDPKVYVIYSEEELRRRREKYEPKGITARDEVPEKYRLQGRRKGFFAHDIKFDYERKDGPITLFAQRTNFGRFKQKASDF